MSRIVNKTPVQGARSLQQELTSKTCVFSEHLLQPQSKITARYHNRTAMYGL